MEVEKYLIVKADKDDALVDKINREVKNGYQAQGGIAVNSTESLGGDYRFYQLMVKYKEPEIVLKEKVKTIVK